MSALRDSLFYHKKTCYNPVIEFPGWGGGGGVMLFCIIETAPNFNAVSLAVVYQNKLTSFLHSFVPLILKCICKIPGIYHIL